MGLSQRPPLPDCAEAWAGVQAYHFLSHPGETQFTPSPWNARAALCPALPKPSPSAGSLSATLTISKLKSQICFLHPSNSNG